VTGDLTGGAAAGVVASLGVGALVALAVLLAAVPWRPARGVGSLRAPGDEPRGRPATRRRAGARGAADGLPDAAEAPLDAAFVLDLCATAVRGGAAVPTALVGTGRHLGGSDGEALVRAGTALGMGAPWDVAWAGAPAAVAAVGAALRVGWDAGSSPGPLLRAAADRLRRERRAAARAAAGALGVRLTLPLGVCFLPAFVVLGLVPVVLGLAGDLLGP
jgi:hypothetical protein